jgi:hypothetical protein
MDASDRHFSAAALGPVPIEHEAGWAPELVWTFWEKRNVLLQSGF